MTWDQKEIDLVVRDYLEMLALDRAGTTFNRAERNRQLQQQIGRSKGSIEFKRQNISAVLDRLGVPWLKGFVPLVNFQNALLESLEMRLEVNQELLSPPITLPVSGLSESSEIYIEEPPPLIQSAVGSESNERLRFLIRKFDPAQRDQKNRELGRIGEELVFRSEKLRIKRENPRLCDSVKWISDEQGDGAGFDILSFDERGRERYIEVKTTAGGQRTPFFISSNELAASKHHGSSYSIIRLYDLTRFPKAFEIKPPLEQRISLRATAYRASFEG